MHTLVCEMRVNCFRKYLNLNVLALLTYKEYVKKNAPNTYNQSINCVEAETKMYYEQKSGYISFIKMGLCSFVVSTVLCKSTANEFQRISVFVLRELSPTFAEFSERKETSQTFANANENSDQRKIRLSANVNKSWSPWCFTLFILPTGYHSEDFEHRLLHDLFSGYSKEALPVRNKSEAIEVMFDMAYSQLIYLVRKLRTHILTRYLFKMWSLIM